MPRRPMPRDIPGTVPVPRRHPRRPQRHHPKARLTRHRPLGYGPRFLQSLRR